MEMRREKSSKLFHIQLCVGDGEERRKKTKQLCGRQRRAEDRRFLLKCEESCGVVSTELKFLTQTSDRSLTSTHTQSSRDDEAESVIAGLLPNKTKTTTTTTAPAILIDQITAGRIPHPSGWTPTATPIRRRKVRQPTFD
jgi:hypothetical protein